ncbi:MAG: hypothetical protein U0640_08080 [Phycisphaerales bacterium]
MNEQPFRLQRLAYFVPGVSLAKPRFTPGYERSRLRRAGKREKHIDIKMNL